MAALPTYVERYPLELDRLFFELFWLSPTHRRRCWEYYEQVAASPSFVVRWALVEVLDGERPDDASSPGADRLEQLYGRLAQDSRNLVAAEAEHALALLRLRWQGQTLPIREYRRLKRQHERARPRLTFEPFSRGVDGYLAATGKRDYDLLFVEQFARYLTDHPIVKAFDYAADGRAFEEWRRHERRQVPF